MGSGDPLLTVDKLEVVYFRVSTAVQGVSLAVAAGSVFAVIGANGAGKTTTLRAISGFLGSDNAHVTDGEIRFGGERIDGVPPHRIARKGISLVPERDKVFETLSTEENLAIIRAPAGGRKGAMERKIYEYFPKLFEQRKHLAGFLSGGVRQMLAMGQALLSGPRLLLVDEFSLGLAPLIVQHLAQTLLEIRADLGLTVLLVEQNASIALRMADHAAVMENGRIVFDGTPQRLLEHQDVREFYLGQSEGGTKSYRDVKQYRRSRRWWG